MKGLKAIQTNKELGSLQRKVQAAKRLNTITEALKTLGQRPYIIDVGCDHGFVPLFLYLQGFYQNVIFCDIKAKPLQMARLSVAKFVPSKNIKQADPTPIKDAGRLIDEHIEFRQTDGLCDVQIMDNAAISICGMGGINIAAILHNSFSAWQHCRNLGFVLQAQTKYDVLLETLESLDIQIAGEFPCVDLEGRFYLVVTALYRAEDACAVKNAEAFKQTTEQSFAADMAFRSSVMAFYDNTFYETFKPEISKCLQQLPLNSQVEPQKRLTCFARVFGLLTSRYMILKIAGANFAEGIICNSLNCGQKLENMSAAINPRQQMRRFTSFDFNQRLQKIAGKLRQKAMYDPESQEALALVTVFLSKAGL